MRCWDAGRGENFWLQSFKQGLSEYAERLVLLHVGNLDTYGQEGGEPKAEFPASSSPSASTGLSLRFSLDECSRLIMSPVPASGNSSMSRSKSSYERATDRLSSYLEIIATHIDQCLERRGSDTQACPTALCIQSCADGQGRDVEIPVDSLLW